MSKLNSFILFSLAMLVISCKDNPTPASNTVEKAATTEGLKYEVTNETAIINWEGKSPLHTNNGTIKLSGELFADENGVTSGTFIIDINSISANNSDEGEKLSLESHLKGLEAEGADDFFNVNKYPTGKFEIVSITPTEQVGANSIVKGNLTLKDITKEISFPATISMAEGTVNVTTDQFTINRLDWGINYNSKSVFKNLGDKFIDDNIYLQIMVSAKAAAM